MRVLLRTIGVVLLLTGCNPGKQTFNETAERKMIVENIETNLRGLLNSNTDEAMAEFKSDSAFVIGKGKIEKLSRAEFQKAFEDQFKKGKYTAATKLDDPVIVFSGDGAMAWYVGSFQFQYSFKDSLGNMRTNKFNDALLCVLEKKDNQWSLVAQAETFRDEK